MATLLTAIRPFVDRILFVVNGKLTVDSRRIMKPLVDEILVRDNEGYDVWAYKDALETIGFDALKDYDELLLFNHTFYGPIFPFSEMFAEMEGRSCDFWGISAHKACQNPFTGIGTLPLHINSHFIAVRKSMLAARNFREYWEKIPPITSYVESILLHESQFTQHFVDIGYSFEVYLDPEDYGSDYATFINIDETISNRSPILKRRPFFHDPLMAEHFSIDLPRALRLVKETSDYDTTQIWNNIARTSTLRTLNTNAALTKVLPDISDASESALSAAGKVAICAHIYYVDMVPELLALAANVPAPFDFLATTDSEKKKAAIEAQVEGHPGVRKVIVRVMEQNRGRDMAALFITMRDIFLGDDYDLVCRLHSKKSPQVEASRSNHFKRHMFDNLLHSRGYVANVLQMFAENAAIGVALPPLVHMGFPTMGHSWFGNQPRVEEIAKQLGLKVKFDEHTPIAAYGTMFWFRPKALRPLFERKWKYEDFNAEPHHVDGGLAHALERIICYVAQDRGYITHQILCPEQAAFSYVWLEYKLAQLCSWLPNGDFGYCNDVLGRWKGAGYPLSFQVPPPAEPEPAPEPVPDEPILVLEPVPATPEPSPPALRTPTPKPPSVRATFREFRRAMKRSIRKRFGRLFGRKAKKAA
jgi:rhamnosyltransferase